MYRLLLPLLAVLTLCACHQGKTNHASFLNTDSLAVQLVTIDNAKDTVITTANGARLHFTAGSLSTPTAQIRIKEAYGIDQMVLAGLTTQSDGKPLRSGGMIYINAVDKNVNLLKAVEISIPTNSYDNSMQLYTGEEKDGKVNWTDPKPVQDNEPAEVKQGRKIFIEQCAACHAVSRKTIGPALSRVDERGPWCDPVKLHLFTKDWSKWMPASEYTRKMTEEYRTTMPAFPELSDTDIDNIYNYIKNEDIKNGIAGMNGPYSMACKDSCRIYDSRLAQAAGLEELQQQQRAALIKENGPRINYLTEIPTIESSDTEGKIVTYIDKVEPLHYSSIYYRFDIKAFGWYNIDRLEDTDGTAQLNVKIEGAYKENPSVFFVVPAKHVFAEGGLLNDDSTYGFFAKDGMILLSPGQTVTVFTVGEADGGIVFDAQTFISAPSQTIVLTPKPVTKHEFNKAVRHFRLSDITIKARKSKNADELRKNARSMQEKQTELEKYRPKNCACHCYSPMADSTTIVGIK